MSRTTDSWMKIAEIPTAEFSNFPWLSHGHALIMHTFILSLIEQKSRRKVFLVASVVTTHYSEEEIY